MADWERLNDLSCSLEQQLSQLLQDISSCGEEMKVTLAKQKQLAASQSERRPMLELPGLPGELREVPSPKSKEKPMPTAGANELFLRPSRQETVSFHHFSSVFITFERISQRFLYEK